MRWRIDAAYGWLALAGLLCAGCGGGSGSPPPAGSSPAPPSRGVELIDSAMQGIMDRHAPPGLAVAVVRDGKLAVANAYGHADLAASEPLRPDHLFRVASVSKPVTGIAAAKAIEDGLLDPDALVVDVLAGYLPATAVDARLPDMRVRHLLHHTGGWNYYDYPRDPLFRSGEIADETGAALPLNPDALIRWVMTQPVAFDPGTNFAYTNIGYVALGRVLEQATGAPYEELVQRLVLQPANISAARLGGITRAERMTNEVEYESVRNPIWTSVFDGQTVVAEPAYGGLNLLGFDASSAWLMSVVDMARLGAATDGDSAYPDVISGASVDFMTTVGTPAGTTAVGIAWFLDTASTGDVNRWAHSGGMPGTVAYLARLPSGVIIAIVSNTDRGGFLQETIDRLTVAIEGVAVWPEDDLFANF